MKGKNRTPGVRSLTLITLLWTLAACASSPRRGGPTAAPVPLEPDRDPSAGTTSDPLVEAPAGTPLVLAGGCGEPEVEIPAKYFLPFPVAERYELTQGNCRPPSHRGRFRYSFDFRMPVGSEVTAARDGVVWWVREDGPEGTNRVGDENYVIVRHEDGEFSRYLHLARDGVLVEVGQIVSRGDLLARSGASGRSRFPHLHFDVATGCDEGRCVTIPAAFSNSRPAIPAKRALYTAHPSTGG